MSFFLIMTGMFLLFGGAMVAGLSIIGLIPYVLLPIIVLVLGFVGGLVLLLTGFLAGGIVGPFMSAKFKHQDIVAVLTAGKRIHILSGTEKGGIMDTKRGSFFEIPDAIYTWPNGVNGGLAFHKYGVTLPLKIIRGATKLKEAGILNIEQYEQIAAKIAQQGKDFVVEL